MSSYLQREDCLVTWREYCFRNWRKISSPPLTCLYFFRQIIRVAKKKSWKLRYGSWWEKYLYVYRVYVHKENGKQSETLHRRYKGTEERTAKGEIDSEIAISKCKSCLVKQYIIVLPFRKEMYQVKGLSRLLWNDSVDPQKRICAKLCICVRWQSLTYDFTAFYTSTLRSSSSLSPLFFVISLSFLLKSLEYCSLLPLQHFTAYACTIGSIIFLSPFFPLAFFFAQWYVAFLHAGIR